jgi:hypothetical protein
MGASILSPREPPAHLQVGGIMPILVRRYGLLVIIVGVVAIIGISSVIFRDRLPASAVELQVGDCFDIADPSASAVEEVPHHPCTESHQYEVFFNAVDTSPTDATYPPLTAFNTDAANMCVPAFEAYVGIAPDASTLDVGYLYPQETGWGKGDRTVTCYLTRSDSAPMTTTMKGAKQ